MTPYVLLTHFEALAEAPNGIQRLRELVLELAVRGKLVEQNPEDEAASTFYAAVQAERIRLAKAGLIKPLKMQATPSRGDELFSIPASWVWCRFGQLLLEGPTNGWSPTTVNYPTKIKTLPLSATTKGWFDGSRYKYVDADIPADSPIWLQPGDYLIQRSNTRDYVGMPAIFDGMPGQFIYPDLMMRCRFASMVNRRFVHIFQLAPAGRAYLQEKASGTSSSMVKIGQEPVRMMPIPLPPEAEQRRIVARVDELMALLDRLEAKHHDRDSARTAARDSAVAALREAPTPDDVETAWLRIQERFHELFATPEDVASLRQAILRLGLSGRLATVRPDTGAADDFLGRIRRARSSQNHSGKSRSKNAHSEQTFDDAPFVIPSSWRWCRMADLVSMVTSGSRSWHAHYAESGASFIRSQDIKLDRLEYDNRAFVNPPEGTEGMRTRVEAGDLLLTITGGNVGKCALISSDPGEAYVSQHVALIRAVWKPMGPYLHRWLTADFGGRGLLLDTSYGAKPGLNLGSIRNLLVPIPPEDEIPSILSQLNEFLAGCERLAELLTAASNQRSAFAAAAVHHLDA